MVPDDTGWWVHPEAGPCWFERTMRGNLIWWEYNRENHILLRREYTPDNMWEKNDNPDYHQEVTNEHMILLMRRSLTDPLRSGDLLTTKLPIVENTTKSTTPLFSLIGKF